METIISACVSGVVALIVAYFMYKMNEVISRIEEIAKQQDALIREHKDLSGEHKGLSGEHKDLSKENNNIITSVALVSQTAADTKIIAAQAVNILAEMHTATEKERIAQQFRYDNLTERQKSITENVSDSIKVFEALKDELLRVNQKNSTLNSQMQVISQESDAVKTLNFELNQNNRELMYEFNELLAHDKMLTEKCRTDKPITARH